MTEKFKPICMERQLLLPEDGRRDVAWCCLWTKKERKLEEIRSKGWIVPGVIGNLYSHKRGTDLLIRNLLANPQIRFLVIQGAEMNDSGDKLRYLLANGVTSELLREYGVGADIPTEVIKQLFYPELLTVIHSPELLSEYDEMADSPRGIPEIFTPKPPELSLQAPGSHVGAIVRGSSIAETWLRLLKHIRLYGQVSGTHYDMRQQEVYGLLAVVEDEPVMRANIEDNVPLAWDPFLPMEGFEEYAERLWNGGLPEGVQYTYGYRLRHGLSKEMGDVDQINAMIAKLMQDPDQRSACASLWYGSDSATKSGTPCVDFIACRVINNKFLMSVIIRSNDMAGAWPMNVAGFRRMQHRILAAIQNDTRMVGDPDDVKFWDNVAIGATEIYSLSAHIYEDSWVAADDMVAKYHEKYTGRVAHPADPFGNWIIEVNDFDKTLFITAKLLGPDEKVHKMFVGRTAGVVRSQISQYVHDSDHAMYLGMELEKAELCIKLGAPYVQDVAIQLVP